MSSLVASDQRSLPSHPLIHHSPPFFRNQNLDSKSERTSRAQPSTMCNYWSIEPLCGHRTLHAGSNCYLLFAQLNRINDPRELARPGLPFEVPHECLPNRWNVQPKYVNEYCSWECRNNGMYADRRCGERDARYGPGSERIGVGWRY